MKNLEEKTLSTVQIYKGRVINLQVDQVVLPNGETSYREIVKHPGAVAIMAITTENKLVLVRQFRKALEKTIYEIPAGKIELGENLATCALRELEEETGYLAEKLEKLGGFYTSPGFADEYIHLFRAHQLKTGKISLDQDEFVEPEEFTLDQCMEKIASREICDAKTIYAIMIWQMEQLNK